MRLLGSRCWRDGPGPGGAAGAGATDNATGAVINPILLRPRREVKRQFTHDLTRLQAAIEAAVAAGDGDHLERLGKVYARAVQVARLGGAS